MSEVDSEEERPRGVKLVEMEAKTLIQRSKIPSIDYVINPVAV